MKNNMRFFIAIRYLMGRAREGGRYLRGAATGIAVSLVPIIVTLIVADGMIRGIVDRYMELGTGHIQVFNYYEPEKLEDAVEIIKKTGGIRGVWHEQRSMGILAGKESKTGAQVRAIDPLFWADKGGAAYLETRSGTAVMETNRDMLLGESLAAVIGAEVGDTVRLMTTRSDTGRRVPRVNAFTVKGIVSSGYHELDSLWCIITLEGGRRIVSGDASASSLIVKIDDPYKKADDAVMALYSVLGMGYNIYTWKELMHSQYSSYVSTRQLLLFIMALIVIIAAVNVSSATSMLVLERQRDIAVLKVTGAGVADTRGIFLWGSFLTGIAGAAFGIALGLLIGININHLIRFLEKFLSFCSGLFHGNEVKILDPGFYLASIPIIIDWTAVLLIGLFTVLCSCIASWIPAHRAGKLKPMELIRKY